MSIGPIVMIPAMLLFAVVEKHATALEKLKQVPPNVWLKLGLAVLAVILVVIILRKVMQMNKVVLTIAVLVALSTIGFSWIYNRNEPSWATPVVEKLAGFFPSKGAYATKQATPAKP